MLKYMALASISTVWVSAMPSLQARDFPAYEAPGPGDVRSPCPALNSLANHGSLPHDGKQISLPTIITAFKNIYNIDAVFATFLFSGALLVSSDPKSGTFNLNDLDKHNAIEHDASLSRSDAYLGNNTVFNQTLFDSVLAFYDGMDNATIPVASRARYSRVEDSMTRNPEYTMDANHLFLSYGETALYLSIMGDPTTGEAPVDFVRVFFEQERLPYDEGWRTPTQLVTLASIVDMQGRLYASSPNPAAEALQSITVGSYRLALADVDMLKQELGPLFCTILAALC